MSPENKSLISLVEQASQIESFLIEAGGELTPDIEKLLEVNGKDLALKVDSYSMILARMKYTAAFYKRRAEIFLDLADASEKVIDRLSNNLEFAMRTLDVKEIEGEDVGFKFVKAPPSVVIEDGEKVPADYQNIKQTITPDKKRIGEDLKNGVPVPGCKLHQGEYLKEYVKKPKGKK